MFEKSLHAGNIAAAFAIAATAADLTFAGGAGTAIGAALSGMALFKKSDKAVKASAKDMAIQMQAYFDNSALSDGRKKITAQMLKQFPPSGTDLAKGNMDAKIIATNLRESIADTTNDPAHKTETALTDFADALAATLGPALVAQNQTEAMLQELLARTSQTGDLNRLTGEGITETAIIRLAQRIAGETDDLGQAWLTLQDAMDTAVRVQREGRITSNHGDFVNEAQARVAALAADGKYADAGDAIDAALAEEDAASARRKTRLLVSGVEVARLAGDAVRAANLLLQQTDLAAGGVADFESLRRLRRGHYETGRDKGIALDLEIAIELAHHVQTRSNGRDQRGTALNDLGVALQTLGERESGAARLDQAVVAYREALKERTRGKVPQGWSVTQNNLGNALSILGERESGTVRLDQAVAAYCEALKERTRDKLPLEWAAMQNNLGNALNALGGRESGTARLDQAVVAYRAALQEWTRDKVPLEWAGAQNNLGNVLQALGSREGGTARLDQAVVAYRAALQEWTRDKVPLNWAMTQNNLGGVYIAWFDKTNDPAHLDTAQTHVQDALEVFNQGAPHYAGMAQAQLQQIEQRR